MCGIAGYSTLGAEQHCDPAHIGPMLSAIRHRGPDDRGDAAFPKVVLGNARLSIIDVDHGHQPITNADGSTIIVCNGELYNTAQLRKGLEADGLVFRTGTDTEAIVHLYDRDGLDCLTQLNGMFAFALYDRKLNRLVVARDRFGVKPLYYQYRNGSLAFASELKALKTLPSFATELDPEALSVFLGLFYIPEPWSIYRYTKKLRSGHMLILDERGLQEREYHDISYRPVRSVSNDEAETTIADLFEKAVTSQLVSDVPVGVLLSGGLDSRSVLAVTAKSIANVPSFTISFNERQFSEEDAASYWAKRLGSAHHPFIFREADFLGNVLARQHDLDEPYGLWCNVASARMARFIHESGYKVILSGEGGDELFFGYPTVHAAYTLGWLGKLPAPMLAAMSKCAHLLPAKNEGLPLSFKIKSFVDALDPNIFRTFFGFKEVVRYRTWGETLTPDAFAQVGSIDPYLAFRQYESKITGLPLPDALSYLDFKVFLPGCCFAGADNAYMAHSVECRVPFMDNDLVDYVTGLPVSQRFNPVKPKQLLRRAFQRMQVTKPDGPLPPYQKIGFEVPANVWLASGGFRQQLSEILSPERLKRAGFFRPEAVKRILDDQLAGRQNNERVLQAVMSLQLFLERG